MGCGLNVPAEIKLYSAWCVDKKTKERIKDKSDPRHNKHLERLESIPNTQYIGFHNETGCWMFRVEHFTKYGLYDDDDDDDEINISNQVIEETDHITEDESQSFFVEDSFANTTVGTRKSQMNVVELGLDRRDDCEDEIEDESKESDESDSRYEVDDSLELYEETQTGSSEECGSEADSDNSSMNVMSNHISFSSVVGVVPDESMHMSDLSYDCPDEAHENDSKINTPLHKTPKKYADTPILSGTLLVEKRFRNDWSGDDQSLNGVDSKKLLLTTELVIPDLIENCVEAKLIKSVTIFKSSISSGENAQFKQTRFLARSFRVGWSKRGTFAVCRPSTTQNERISFETVTIFNYQSCSDVIFNLIINY